jgi:adenylate cyclase
MRFLKSLLFINPASLTLCTILVVVTLFFSGTPILDLIELKTYDLRFRSRGSVPPSPAVVMALIDEKSLDTEGRWPWPRSKLATLVDILSQDGAKVIGFDIGFLEPDENSQLAFITQLAQKVDALGITHPQLADFIQESKQHADNDLILAHAIQNSSAAVVLGYFFHMSEADLNYRIEQRNIDQQLQRISASKYPFISYQEPAMDVVPFLRSYAPESNLALFTEAAASSGYFSLRSDQEDGVVRWMPLMIQGGEDLFPPLAVWCAWHYLGKPQLTVKVGRYGVEGIQMGQRFIPTDEAGQLLINYLGPPKTFAHVSISDILRGRVARGTFTDKIVLIGAIAMGAYDVKSTPFSTVYPGVEIHATVTDNILTQNFLTKPRWSKMYDLLAIITLGALIGIALPWMGAFKGLLFATSLFILYIFIAHWFFVYFEVWLNMIYPLLTLSTTYTAFTVYNYVTEEKEKRMIKGIFQHYVSAKLVDELINKPSMLKLGGEKRVMTVFFSDIEGFTSIAEQITPEELVVLLNEYLTAMTDIILKYDGMVDKYEGDAIMAVWGAPVYFEDHAKKACFAALEMQKKLVELRKKWLSEGKPEIHARIGINTGEMIAGNMGSRDRMDYTVMGDAVNVASRLEGANKQYGTYTMISESTLEYVKDHVTVRELDSIRVKGRLKPVRIYELLVTKEECLSEQMQNVIEYYNRGIEAYKNQQWDEAIIAFESSLSIDGEKDTPSKHYLNLCEEMKLNPPGSDWDSVYIMKKK